MAAVINESNYTRALDFLYGRVNFERSTKIPYGERRFKLARMSELAERLGNPQAGLPIVHVAGTKGKGSTAAMIAAALASRYRVGVFSSPHLFRIEERFVVDAEACTPAELVELVEYVRPAVAAMDKTHGEGPTYFEITTAMALLHFARRQVDLGVLEVGLGGRLDSTNFCQPSVCVITSISFDHTAQLGNTLAAIAGEKAGIIKPGVPVVSGVTADEPRAVIDEAARTAGAPLVQVGRDFHFRYHQPGQVSIAAGESASSARTQLGPEAAGPEAARPVAVGSVEPVAGNIDFHFAGDRPAGNSCSEGWPAKGLKNVQLGLLGPHQAANAAVAVATLGELVRQGWHCGENDLRRGLANVRCPARVELVWRDPAILVDTAHNVASVDALLATLAESFPRGRRGLIFSASRDKDARGMLTSLLPAFDEVVLTRYTSNPRAVPPDELARIAATVAHGQVTVCADPAAAWKRLHERLAELDLVCVTGSFFIAAEVLDEIRQLPVAGDFSLRSA